MPALNFSSNVQVEAEGVVVCGRFERDKCRALLQVTQPQNLAGMTFIRENSENFCAKDDVKFKLNVGEHLKNSSIFCLVDLMENLEKNETFLCEQTLNNQKFTVKLDNNKKFIEKISCEKLQLSAYFYDQKCA